MTTQTIKSFDSFLVEGGNKITFQRNLMALDALSKLARQFSNQPQLERLSDLLLLTVAGQFSIGSAFLSFSHPGLADPRHAFQGIGKFKKNSVLERLELDNQVSDYFIAHPSPVDLELLIELEDCHDFAATLKDNGVFIVVPFVHNDSIIGLLGLGEKVTGKPYDVNDLEILSTFAHSITPFVSNSLLFREISDLNRWYVDILNSVEQSVLIFDSRQILKLANTSAVCILEKLYGNVGIFLSKRPTIKEVLNDTVFPGWLMRIDASEIYSSGRMLENMTAYIADREFIYNVRVGKIRQETRGDYDTFITLDDITDQKASELRLYEVEKLAEKGIMVASISHELNNFLGLILGGAEIAAMSLNKGNTDKVSATLEKIKANVGRMERYTSGLVDLARLNTSKEETNLNSVIAEVLSFVSVQKRYKRITIHTDLARDLPPFVFDSDQMSQLLMNLVNNAADAIVESGRPNREISVTTRLDDNKAVLSVTDNGVGIPPDVKDRLFKAHLTTKENGHGYGLVTCAKIIDNHRGEVDIKTEIGQGTTFTLSFPIDQSENESADDLKDA